MSAQLEKVATTDLKVGLYVERLDRPWTETPFLFQGFFIHDQDEIEALQHHCRHVYVDAWRSLEGTLPGAANAHAGSGHLPLDGSRRAQAQVPLSPPGARSREVYEKRVAVEHEMPVAERIHVEAGRITKAILTGLQQDGRLDIDLAREIVEPMMESVLRNPDALIWLSRMKHHDAYIYHHSVNCSIWGLAFARHLGLDKQSIYEIGLGCMLFDVGKTRLPGALLGKADSLTADEWKVAKEHVQHSVDILEHTGGVTNRIMNMVRSHHERFDGSGYPDRLMGNHIPTFAKIAGMVDCYDALVSPRPYAKQRAPYEAIREIYHWRENLFQKEVVEQFMQVVGVFPTGSLVELNNGAVGVVIAQNETRRLRPRIMLLLDENKRRLPHFDTVDLLRDEPWYHTEQFWIEKHLPPGSYGIDPQELYL